MIRRTFFHPVLTILFFFLVLLVIAPALASEKLMYRHSQCDLHTTTNILETPLDEKCTQPFTPAQFDASGNLIQGASARCCTSDITLDEFKSLKGKMDAFKEI